MTIQQIKERLSITAVLSQYGLTPDRNGMLKCPFHEDKRASMKVYEETGTVYCFAGGCEVDYLDGIDFIMRKEGCTKHEAIVKAKKLVGQQPPLTPPKGEDRAAQAISPATFNRYLKAMATHRKAQEYCEGRGLDWRALEIGYKSRKTKDRWARGCIVFPLRNEQGDIASLYGRSVYGEGPASADPSTQSFDGRRATAGRHYYQTGRSGLYPSYPPADTKRLILTESVIDAASLWQLEAVREEYSVLALYGTGGLSEEHRRVILGLKKLEEVIFCLDADEAGREATQRYARLLFAERPALRLKQVKLLEGEDVNSVVQDHMPEIILRAIVDREAVRLEKSGKASAPVTVKPASPAVLNTSNPYNLIYTTQLATYYIKGGLRCGSRDLDSLKVTLVVENEQGKKSRQRVDLYEDRQVDKAARAAADRLGLRADLLKLDLQRLTDELETYREELQQEAGRSAGAERIVAVPAGARERCEAFLRRADLMSAIDERLEAYGLVGERNNRRLGFCIVSSYGMPEPLHGLIQGTSGSGKTHLLSSLCALVPPERYIPITRATDNSFYNYAPFELKGKLISVEDKDAMSEESNLAFRELQTRGMLSTSTTGQDEQGNSRSFIKQVFGPIASLACTTRGELYLDDMNRCFLLAVDESGEQTVRVLDYQKRVAAGLVDTSQRTGIEEELRNCLRLLRPYEVVIPYAPRISLPAEVKDKRRLNSLYLALVKQVTLLHQYQRRRDGQGRLVSTPEDLAIANEIMFDAIVLKVDELHGPLRSFYEKLKGYLREVAGEHAAGYSFKQREVRQALRLSKTNVYNHLKELLELEYVQIVGGSDRRGFDYKIAYWDDNEALRKRIKAYLAAQIEQLKEK